MSGDTNYGAIDPKYNNTMNEVSICKCCGWKKYGKNRCVNHACITNQRTNQPGPYYIPGTWENTTPQYAVDENVVRDIENALVEDDDLPCDYPFDFDEGRYLDELRDYIGKTYDQHYAKGIQVTKFIMSHMNSPDFLRGNVLKYTTRYGRKEGYNRNDILKALHYAILMLYYHDTVFHNKKGLNDND